MDYQSFFNVLFGIVTTMTGWLGREVWQGLRTLEKEHSMLREEVAKNYIPKEEFHTFRTELLGALRRIEEKLDHKENVK